MKKLVIALFSFLALSQVSAQSQSVDYRTIPVSNKQLGEFPFFEFPISLKAMNIPYQNADDHLFIPINGKFKEFTGQVWRSFVQANGENWSLFSFNKKISSWIVSKGGVPVYKGKIARSQLDLVKEKMDYAGAEGSIDYWNNPVNVYIIKQADRNIFVQFSGNTASGEIQIIETKEGF
ncbi:hypothetical protein [Rhizosphaericola mali]|uniref:DUF4251 domain-containing protein n=1 Tax=Rhizosphaericola mali TaxID=2545455 RepID=A0A5P2G6R3_9BACT|nr:hypothetical protein [Rhizosphaericola mali]QES87201.1 hypothetical protein E0W69_000480 [Rhizosphaericola mali]